MSEKASLKQTKRIKISEGAVLVRRPTLRTVAVLAGKLRESGADLDSITDGEGNIGIVLILVENLPAVTRTILSKDDGGDLTEDEVADLSIDDGMLIASELLSMIDGKALARLKASVRAFKS